MIHAIILANVVATALALATRGADSWTPGQEVETQSGRVKGHVAQWPPGRDVSEYLGIPYAKPPVGSLRFAPPVLNKSNATFVADKYANDCTPTMGGNSQGTSNGPEGLKGYGIGMGAPTPNDPHKYDEDCLGLNIWTKPQTGERSKAVLLWIYGGGFSSGTAHAPYMYGGRLVDEEDVVVVSFNYRVGLNGFPNAPGLEYQNPGLMDQRLATEWVRDNIAQFGGDPKRITIFGESAGGFSVDYYAYAWPKDPIVNGFIAQSGTVSGSRAMGRDQAADFNSWYKLSTQLGCGGADAGAKTVDCVRSKSQEDVAKAASSQRLSFGPRADGKVVFSDNKARGEAGDFIKRPLIAGNTDFEAGLTLVMMGGKSPGGSGSPGQGLGIGPSAMDANSGCGASSAAQVRTKNNVSAWVYRFDGVYENQRLSPDSIAGAYHSSDVPMTFGTTELRPGVPKDTPEQAKLSKHWRHAWAEFAKDPENGLKRLGWPVYDPTKETLIRLGYKNGSEPVFASNAPYIKSCG